MLDAPPTLSRQGSVARTNAVAMLKRAASHREMKSRADTPVLPGAFPSASESSNLSSSPNALADASQLTAELETSQLLSPHSTLDPSHNPNLAQHAAITASNPASPSLNRSADPAMSQSSSQQNLVPAHSDNVGASTSKLPVPGAILSSSSPNGSHDCPVSTVSQERSNQRPFNRSPLPSLEQLRARILLERESAGLQRSASTSAASQAARAYALEKLLGNSGTDVFFDHTPDGTPIGRGAATPSPPRVSGRDHDVPDMASDDESAHKTRLKRQSIKNRPLLRRSRTINGLTAMAEAQNKAEFVQGVFLAVPGPASNRISRIHQRRVERQSMLKSASITPAQAPQAPQAPVAQHDTLTPALSLDAHSEATPTLSRQQSQRQVARTEMLRKLSTRGRSNATPTPQPSTHQPQPTDDTTSSQEHTVRHARLPQVITNSPAVDESISPVEVVIRPPSSPVPPHLSFQSAQVSRSPAPSFREALSPASAAGVDAHTYAAAPSEAASSPGLNPSSSTASLTSHYAHSTATNATARHIHERNRESVMALLNNEDSFALDMSPSAPPTSFDAEAALSSIRDTSIGDIAPRASASRNADASGDDELQLDLASGTQTRHTGLVGLGLDSLPSQGASATVVAGAPSIPEEQKLGSSPARQQDPSTSKRVSKLQQKLDRLRVQQPTTQELLSSPGSYTDEESLEDEAFYKLYSPVTGGSDEDDDDDSDQNETSDPAGAPEKASTTSAEGSRKKAPSAPSEVERQANMSAVRGLGLVTVGGISKHTQPSPKSPTTPPEQRLFHRGMASVPCDPSPSTETEFGEARRTPWMHASPGGFNLPLRLSNSLVSSDSPAPDPGAATMHGANASRNVRGDWPMSIASSGTNPPSRESLEGQSEVEARLRSFEEARAVNGVPAIGSPLIEVPEDESIRDAEHSAPQPTDTMAEPATADSEFELLAVPTSRQKPSQRVQAMLGSSFVAEYGADMDLDTRSRSSVGGDEHNHLTVADPHTNGSSLSNNNSSLSINEASDVDGEVDDAYLRKVDRMADKLGKIARMNKALHIESVSGTPTTSTRAAVALTAPKLERSNTATGSRFTEHVSNPPKPPHPPQSSHSQCPSADLSALVGNEKLHPFPGLSQAGSPVQMQEAFTPMAVSMAPPSSAPAGVSDTPLHTIASKAENDANAKQIGLFSSLRRKASSLRRTPSSAAKESASFWSRRGAKKTESPKVPTEASFISAPILTEATPGPAPTPSQPIVTVEGPQDEALRSVARRERDNDATFEHRLFGGQSTDISAAETGAAELQRNASISSVVSARVRPDLQDGTADTDGSMSSDHHAAAVKSLAPTTAAIIHRYSRMLSSAGPTQTVPGTTQEDMLDPPRKLLATDPVFQVISATTIKDRYLFLFNDILVIAKPVSAPGAEAGQPLGKMKQAAVLPSLSWKFSVKNILELHRLKVSVTTNTRTASAKTRAQNPVLWGFVSHFSKDPDAAVRALVAKTGLEPTPASIAQLLYQTPELDRHDLTQYLGHPSRREILKAYVSQHRHVGVSIESALRTLLLDLRFFTDLDAFEALLVYFAQSWTQHNATMIKPTFTVQIASDLVFAIMALNDALHTGSQAGPSSVISPNFPRPVTVVTPGLFSGPCPELSKSDFVTVFRQHDPQAVLSDRTLSRIYLSIRSEPLVQALDRFEPRFTIRVKGGKLPTRLTYAQPAEPITLVIPAPDPDLAIRLYAQDTSFEPPVLTFSASNEASFTMWTKSLGPKQIVFVRAGRNARFYGGSEIDVTDSAGGTLQEDSPLPRSFNVSVERAFMKHSFTLSSISADKEAKRFMFSFESAETVERWCKMIREQAERCLKEKAARSAGDVGVVRAMEMASLQVLRESLIGANEAQSMAALSRAPMAVGGGGDSGAARSDSVQASGAVRAGHGGLGISSNPASSTGLRAPALLDRTTSTSRTYYSSSGVGRHERELLIPALSASTGHESSAPVSGEMKGHTKASASLSLYPPSTGRTRFGGANGNGGGVGVNVSVGRSNSARSASSPYPPLSTESLHAGTTGSSHDVGLDSTRPIPRADVAAEKILLGTQIVSITRLNSLLVGVVAFHQQQLT